MQPPRRELSPIELPRALVYTSAVTCGVLAALAAQLYLSRFDLGIWAFGQNLLSGKAMQLRTALPWWAIAFVAFVVSGATAAALSHLPLPWRRFRLLRWLAGALIVYGLADIGHSASIPQGVAAGANVAASLAALGLAGLMAMLGAYIGTALRREAASPPSG
jgi:hypothetical protein